MATKTKSEFEYRFSFNQENVINFAEASGDFNPIHLDEEFAKKTIFKRRIIHGFLGGSVFSMVFGTKYPGAGTIYLNQNMIFYKPMYIESEYVAKFFIKEVYSEKSRALVHTEIYSEAGNLVIGGEALIQHDIFKNQ
jgi:acyl dehydratase